MKLLKDLVSYFTKITTGTLLICCVAVKISGVEEWTTDILWHIPLLGLVISLLTVILLTDKECSRLERTIRFVVHYILISAAVLTAGAWFGWYTPSVPGCLVMLLYVAAVYAFTYLTQYLSSKKSAEELNKALERRRNGKS